MIANDKRIKELVDEFQMIKPFYPNLIRRVWPQGDDRPVKAISYGLSSYGYDLRVGNTFKIFNNTHCAEVDPKNIDESTFAEVTVKDHEFIRIPPNSFALASSKEYFRIPDHVMTICVGKSTYARTGIITNVTPFEPGWEGHVTLEISNTTPLPARIYAGEGLCQVILFEGERPETTYADRNGKYQGQTGITLPKV